MNLTFSILRSHYFTYRFPSLSLSLTLFQASTMNRERRRTSGSITPTLPSGTSTPLIAMTAMLKSPSARELANEAGSSGGGGGGGGQRSKPPNFEANSGDVLLGRVMNGIFGVMHILNNDKVSTYFLVAFEASLDTLQLCWFSFSPEIFPWHTKIADILSTITSIIKLSAFVSTGNK
jgi:hypothetical protein